MRASNRLTAAGTGLGLAALFLVVSVSTTTAAGPDADREPLLPKQLVGAYDIVKAEKYGVPVPEEEIKGTTARFTEDRVVVFDRDKKEVYGATYTLRNDKKPCEITLVSKLAAQEETTALGLIEKEGKTVRLIYALPGGPIPTEFKTKEKQLLFVLEQAEAESKP